MVTDNIEIKKNKYEETRRRFSKFKNGFEISDREIIERLVEEIEQYRKRIKEQNEIIDNLKLESEGCILDTTDELMDPDVEEVITTTKYAAGKLVKMETEYKYKDITKEIANNNPKEIKAIYHAEIYETNDGTMEILYECDKDRCEECTKENCSIEYCTHTLNKKYAKNYYNKKS